MDGDLYAPGGRRAPHGARGLKFYFVRLACVGMAVAPRTGRVD